MGHPSWNFYLHITFLCISEQLKDFKHMFDLVLEGEKHVDQAKNNLVSNVSLTVKKENVL